MTVKSVLQKIKKYFRSISRHRLSSYAAASAFSLFVSAIPFLIILISIIPYTPLSEEWLITLLENILPSKANNFATAIVKELNGETSGAISLSLLVLFWSSSRTLVYFRNGLNDIYGYEEKKNFLLVRIIATLFMFVMILLLVALSFVGVLSREFIDGLIAKGFPNLTWLATIIDYRVLIILVALFVIILLMYVLVPAKKNKFVNELPGALLASLCCFLLLSGFNYVLNSYVSFTMYGSLATIIIIMFYLQFCSFIVFMGASLNIFIRREKITLSKKTKIKILIAVLSGLLYLVLSLPLRDVLSVFTLSEVRPCAVLNPFLGICFGMPAAIGIAFGNLIGDYLSGYSYVVLIEGLLPQFLYTYVPYLLWNKLNQGEEHLHRLNSVKRVLKFVACVLVYALISGLGVGLIVQINYGADLLNCAFFVFLNNLTFGLILGCPLMIVSNLHMAKKYGHERSVSINEKIIIGTALVELATLIIITIYVYTSVNLIGTYDIWNTIFIDSVIALYSWMLISLVVMAIVEQKK